MSDRDLPQLELERAGLGVKAMNDDDIDMLGSCMGACHQGREACRTPAKCARPNQFAMLVQQVRDFCGIYQMYRHAQHGRRYSARIAFGCVFRNLPF